MQYYILVIVILLISIALILGAILNTRNKRKVSRTRESISINEIHDQYFEDLDKEMFKKIWESISKALSMDPTKLLPSDTPGELLKNIHMPDMYYENIESILNENGINPRSFTIEAQISEFVSAIYQNSGQIKKYNSQDKN